MELSSFFVFGILAIFETGALVPILKNGTFGVPFVQDVNSSVEYIIEFNGEKVKDAKWFIFLLCLLTAKILDLS